MNEREWKVLIVDDEFRIGMLVKKLIEWERFRLQCVDIVNDGETAYRIIQESNPDIVITDIRMPRMNGLDLVRMTKESNPGVRFVIISGYKEFEYAHKALQYGVNDYLLKPINEHELNQVMDKLTKELAQSTEALKEQYEWKKTVSASEHIIKRDLLNQILNQEKEYTKAEIEEEYRVVLDGQCYRGIDVKLDYTDHEKTDKKQDRITVEKVMGIVEQKIQEISREELLCERANLHIYGLFNYEQDKSKEVKIVINDILSEIQEYLLGFEQYVVTIGVGSEQTQFARMKFSIEEAKRAVGNRIKLGTGRLIYAENIAVCEPMHAEDYLIPFKESLGAAIESYSKESLNHVINQIYHPFQMEDDKDYSVCYEIAEKLISLFFGQIEAKHKEDEDTERLLKASAHQCYSILRLKELLKKGMGGYLDMILGERKTESTKPIRQAKQYMEAHYAEKITLEDIAQIVDLNPVYFSVVFKKETGLNFTSYLVNVRMEMAKKMIRENNETIAAIAERVGYKDSRYFSQLFTKTVGVKPALYRKIHS